MGEGLWGHALEQELAAGAPLATRMRPQILTEMVGQKEVIGPGSVLRRAIEGDRLFSMIFYGPPGSGKTTLAEVVARVTRSHFETLSAVSSGVADIKRVVGEARERRALYGSRTVLFIDEIHRFNRSQQDALLPAVESGLITLIGSTTENPFFAVNRPLISRSRLYRFDPLTAGDIRTLLERALADPQRGLGNFRAAVTEDALNHLAEGANGDARAALNALELAVMNAVPGDDGLRGVDLAGAAEAARQRVLQYDREDEHYDVVSAWIKSMRGSDPQAAIYWLARLIYAGDDVTFLARRLMIHAAEDVGLADPVALVVATSCAQAVERIGMPEARIVLAEATLYIARAPKSNSVLLGIDRALGAVKEKQLPRVPAHLRDTSYQGAKDLGHGLGYRYPHNFPGHRVEQRYLPEELEGEEFYRPSGQGRDK